MFKKSRPDARVDRLSHLELLSGCSQSELRTIARLTTPALVAPGTALCAEGTPGAEVFIIAAGTAEVVVEGRTVATLGPGDVCGEMAVLEGAARSASITAVSAAEVLVLSAAEFERFLEAAPTAARRVRETCAARRHAAPLAG